MRMPIPRTKRQPADLCRRLLLALTCLNAIACQNDQPANIVLITVDTLRADRLNPYGYEKIETPAIARLAREGIVFEKAFADTSWTLPSLSSVMTGKYPSDHRVRSWFDVLDESERTLAEVLKSAGYKTAAIVGSYPLDRHFGLDQGFDYYDDEMTQSIYARPGATPAARAGNVRTAPGESRRQFQMWQMVRERNNAFRSDAEVADAAIAWLTSNRESPLFLWVHFFGPHEKGKRVKLDREASAAHVAEQIARYDIDVVEMDHQVGRLLDALRADPRFKRTAILFHSDHGQTLDDHGLFGHGLDLFDSTVHVPMIVRLPGAHRAGDRVPHLVRNLDLYSTALELAQLTPAEASDSRSLLAAKPDSSNHVYLETHHPLAFSTKPVKVGEEERWVGRVLRGIRTDRLKLVSRQPYLGLNEDRSKPLSDSFVSESTNVSLYDFESDPRETKNHARFRPKAVDQLQSLLNGYDDGGDSAGSGAELSDAARERLRSLGYEP